MSRQLSVKCFFKWPNSCDVADKRGEQRGTDAVEDEGQTVHADQKEGLSSGRYRKMI